MHLHKFFRYEWQLEFYRHDPNQSAGVLLSRHGAMKHRGAWKEVSAPHSKGANGFVGS
jgi:hypothetical protein